MALLEDLTLKSIGDSLLNSVSDVLANSDFISRTIGMNNSYGDIMFIVQALGHEPVSLLGKNYAFIYDHVRRNYMQGIDIPSKDFEYCNKFTFYKEVPTVRFADPYNDPMNLLDRWIPNMKFTITSMHEGNAAHGLNKLYSESDDDATNNRTIPLLNNIEKGGNEGTFFGAIQSYGPTLDTCDMVGKTNSNFNHGKYRTLIARFHTNSQDSKDGDGTQSAVSEKYGQSHGRNLLKIIPDFPNGYENPYCRVWTYHHQYNQIKRQIRPFGEADSEEKLESLEQVGDYDTVGFRTVYSRNYEIEGGSKRLDRHGVLNYKNGTVNIAPTAKIKDYFEGKENDYDKNIISTKKCMFSIENLAWRDNKSIKNEYDPYGLSPEQKGPLGGRIMWFPPYNLKFGEQVSVNWNSNKFIGRGEDVYTYTNTERRGNLSFTLLIDHPSVLDYWTREDREGKLIEGNIGGIDQLRNEENTLLRFFAGCDILSAKPQEYRKNAPKPIIDPEPKKPVEPTPPPPDVNKKKVHHTIQAILYYPNNYSGKDDKNGVIDPVWYIMNGIGTQRHYNEITQKDEDFAVEINSKIQVNGTNTYGGYEMGTHGISIVTENLAQNSEIIAKSYKSGTNIQYLTQSNGDKITAYYEDNPQFSAPYLTKIIGNKAMSLGSAKIQKNLTGATHQWYRGRYYYRVDKEYENQQFSHVTSYIDGLSYSLNGRGYEEVKKCNSANSRFLKKEEKDKLYKLVSFADVFVALEGDENNVITAYSDSNNVKYIRKIFEDKETYSNITVSFTGHASYQGYKKYNEDLAKNRALTLKRWMKKSILMNGVQMGEPTTIKQPKQTKANAGGVDEKEVKIWRSASLTIEFDTEEVVNAATAEPTKVDDNGNTIVDRVEVKTKETSKNNIVTAWDWLNKTPEGRVVLAANPQLFEKGQALTMQDISKITGKNYFDSESLNYDNSFLNKEVESRRGVVKRYDNEGEFFKALSSKDPFLHHLISEKIKFFDPAFHSISPEGFNARLTFLHQCTRQGSTVGNADSSVANTAYNLAFGRPPVCVLRIGDFYYTKIIINSIDIQYDQPQWDMNPEGIGMMPMYADININFTFLGGSDLGGPIARLQNAVSFNYYANASVYDNRAERVEYEPNGSGKEMKFKGFNYPNIYSGERINLNKIGRMDEQGKIYAEDF
jgi:hypothetical protein